MAKDAFHAWPTRKTTLEIPLHSVRRYVPGSGPPPPRISLVPPRDSTAYIIDQFVLPPDQDMTETSRRLIHYHIGFTDAPAAKLLIPCDKVLDYVSPRELEDWEYRNLEKKEKERARQLAETQQTGPPKKKPGRPPKAPAVDADASAPELEDEALLLAQQLAGPSLATPQKRKLGQALYEGVEYGSHTESDDPITHSQLQQHDAEFEDLEYGVELNGDLEFADRLAQKHDNPGMESVSRPGSLAPSLPDPLLSSQAVSAVETGSKDLPEFLRTNIPAPGMIHPAWAHTVKQQHRQSKPGNSANGDSLEEHGAHSADTRCASGLSQEPEPPIRPALPVSTFRASNSVENVSSRNSTSSRRESPARTSDAGKRKEQPNGMEGPWKTPKKRPKRQKVAEDAADADEWEVKDLLDDQWFEEEGINVHKYLVLWKGDWPEDQNPTWEPAANVLDRTLIKRYQKKKEAGLLKPHQKARKAPHQFFEGRKYSSVAEAFEAGIHDEPAGADVERDTDLPDEMFMVTENEAGLTVNGTKQAPPPMFLSFDDSLARYRQAFPRG